MPNTFTLIASSTVGAGGASNITFSSIPSTYTDLILECSLRTDRAGNTGDSLAISFNGSTSSLSYRNVYGDGSSAASVSASTGNAAIAVGSTATASTFSNCSIYIPNYAGSTNKSVSSDGVTETNGTIAYAMLWATLWSNTAAINSISLSSTNSANFVQYSTAYLYGIKNS